MRMRTKLDSLDIDTIVSGLIENFGEDQLVLWLSDCPISDRKWIEIVDCIDYAYGKVIDDEAVHRIVDTLIVDLM